MSGIIEFVVALFLIAFMYIFLCTPGILVASLGWWWAGRIKRAWLCTLIRAALVSAALAPGPMGHAATPFPALWFMSTREGWIPFLVVWALAIPVVTKVNERLRHGAPVQS